MTRRDAQDKEKEFHGKPQDDPGLAPDGYKWVQEDKGEPHWSLMPNPICPIQLKDKNHETR